MAGADKITDEILREAQRAADSTEAEAQTAASSIREKAGKEIMKMKSDSDSRTEESVRNYTARIQSSIDISKKKAMLAAKQEIIDDVIRKAYQKLDGQDDESYFAMIRKILEKAVQPSEGSIIFSERDLKRMPQGFEGEISRIAAAKGGSLTLSDTAGKMENGFVLSYGGIEENCSLQAIFAEKSDEIRDTAFRILFS